MTCQICCEKYNKSSNLKIICPIGDCNFDACKTCVRQYLISTTNDPNCMKCNAQWTQNFVIENLNKSFWEKEYKLHRTKILTDHEISKIPETIEYAENLLEINKLKEESKLLNEHIKEITKELNTFREKSRQIHSKIYRLENGKSDKERKKFIMPCQNNDCKGYLSSQYKCNICEMFTCPDCFEVIGYNKTDEHICNENNIKSAEEIKKTTKPCPNCGQRIFKLVGCDQMWCTECKVAFSWNTGTIVTKNIHNPHYYEYIKKNGSLNRNENDVVCGGLIQYNIIHYNLIQKLRSESESVVNIRILIENLHRTISHITYHEIVNIRRKLNTLTDFKVLRANYILKLITKEEFSKQIYQNDKLRRKNQEILHIFELLSTYGIEFFRELESSELYTTKYFGLSDKYKSSIVEKFIAKIKIYFNEIKNLFDYCNKQLGIISGTYNLQVMQLSLDNFKMRAIKYNISDLKKLKYNLNSINNNEAGCSSDPL